jgi:predicted DNA-binding transcriptional regulator YafY
VFERMLASLPDRIEVAPGELLPRVEFAESGEARVSPEVIATLSTALTRNETLRISYCPLGEDKPREYVVDPYVLRRAAGAWYLVGLDHESGYIPLFNLTRIATAQPTGETFDYVAAKFFPKEYFRDTFRAFHSREKVRVVIEFSGIAAALVRERHWHASQKLTDLPGGRLRFAAEVSHLDDLWPWVLSWGAGAKVTQPKEFAAQIGNELKQAVGNYAERRVAPRVK